MQDSQLSRSLSHEDSPRAVQLETATVEDQGNTKKEFQYQYLAHNKLESLLVQQDFLQFANILFAKYFKNGSRKEVIQDLHSKLHAPFEPGEFASALLYQSRIALDSNKFGRRGANGSTFIALMHQYFHKLLTYKDCSDLLTF